MNSNSRNYKDAITFKQKILKVMTSADQINIHGDKNYDMVIACLRKGPCTIDEIMDDFKNNDNEKKSEKTIYRYLKELKELEYVTPGGKRINQDEDNKFDSKTLYMRTAKIFYLTAEKKILNRDSKKKNLTDDEIKPEKCNSITERLLEDHFKKKVKIDIIHDVMSEYSVSALKKVEELIENNVEKLNEISDLSFEETQKVIKNLLFVINLEELTINGREKLNEIFL